MKIDWQRKYFKGKKAFVAFDEKGELVLKNGKARIKYLFNQEQEYLASIKNIKSFEEFEKEQIIEEKNVIHIYTDGAAKNNPGDAGIGIYLKYNEKIKKISKYIGIATNNIAELTAIKEALLSIKNKNIPIKIYTDSVYSIGVLVYNWKAKENKDLIFDIKKNMLGFKKIEFIKVKGHSGIAGNEVADKLASFAAEDKKN